MATVKKAKKVDSFKATKKSSSKAKPNSQTRSAQASSFNTNNFFNFDLSQRDRSFLIMAIGVTLVFTLCCGCSGGSVFFGG